MIELSEAHEQSSLPSWAWVVAWEVSVVDHARLELVLASTEGDDIVVPCLPLTALVFEVESSGDHNLISPARLALVVNQCIHGVLPGSEKHQSRAETTRSRAPQLGDILLSLALPVVLLTIDGQTMIRVLLEQ